MIAKDRVEKFAARTRAYICTYYHLEQVREVPPPVAADAVAVTSNSILPKQELLYTEIERLMKSFKGHRCALVVDFDRGFVNFVLKEEERSG